MNCKKCNYRLNPNASFCPKCGQTVEVSRKGNFIKDNILNILIGIFVLVAIGLIITIVSVKINKKIDEPPIVQSTEQTPTPKDNKVVLDETAIATMEDLIVNLVQDYAYAVNIGSPNYLDKYLVHNGEEYKSYQKMIPNYYSKGISLKVLSVDITNIERYDEDTFRASLVTEYEIANSNELRYQKESIDYLINGNKNGIFLVDKSENYSLLKKEIIENYG